MVTRNGSPVGGLTPIRRQRFVSTDTVLELSRLAPSIDINRFRADLDRVVSQEIDPRA